MAEAPVLYLDVSSAARQPARAQGVDRMAGGGAQDNIRWLQEILPVVAVLVSPGELEMVPVAAAEHVY